MTQAQRAAAPRGRRRGARVVASTAALALTAGTLGWTAMGTASAAPGEPVVDPETGWSYAHEALDSGQTFGFQIASDPTTRTAYLTDMRAGTWTRSAEGEAFTNSALPMNKLVEFDMASRTLTKNYDYNGLSRNDGTGPNNEAPPSSLSGTSYSSMRTDFGTYGVAVDPYTPGGATVITTSARQRITNAPVLDDDGNLLKDENGDQVTRTHGGGLVIWQPGSGEAPTDADRVWKFEDGSPVLQGPRRIAVNTETHKAYVTNLGTQRNNGPQPGYILEIDLITKQPTARIAVPEGLGAVGVAVDVENNLIYPGAMANGGLFVIDGDEIDRSNPQSLTINDDTVTKLNVTLGANQRPTYDPIDKRLYVASYDSDTVTVVDADPASSNYGGRIKVLEVADPNAITVDADRGLFYSANLDLGVDVFKTDTFEKVLTLPSSGRAINIEIDPETRDLWLSNWGGSEGRDKVDVYSIYAPGEAPEPGTEDPETIEYIKPGLVQNGNQIRPDAKYNVPTTWTVGQPLVITGEGWVTQAGNAGSGVAVKLANTSKGELVERNEVFELPAPLVGGANFDEEVWHAFQANADGTFSISIPFPTAATATNVPAEGDKIELSLLTGSLLSDDWARGAPSGPAPTGNPVLTVVAEGSTPVDPDPEPEPELTTSDIEVSFSVDATEGGLSLYVSGDKVNLGSASLNETATKYVAEGQLPNVTVTDTRAADLPWAVNGSATAFVNDGDSAAEGAVLAWAPWIVDEATSSSPNAGAWGADLTAGATLVSAEAGQGRGTAVASADLFLEAPTTVGAGSYSSVITLTLS